MISRRKRAARARSNQSSAAWAFVGSVVPPSEMHEYSAVSVAGNRYQYGLLSALERVGAGAVSVFSVRPMEMWRRGSASPLVESGGRFALGAGSVAVAIPFLNVLIGKQLSIAVGVGARLLAWGVARRGDQRVVLVYNSSSYLLAPAWLASRVTRTKLVMILADVPDAGLDHKQTLLRRLEDWARWALLRACDAMVVLTEPAGRDFAGHRPHIVIECGVDADGGETLIRALRESGRRIVHAGSIGYLSGIGLLLDGVLHVELSGVELHLYGDGPQVPQVMALQEERPDLIHYHGRVPHEAALAAEASADVLVCPRIPDGEVTPYTFPSKLFEYLNSGVPVVSTDLEGIPPDVRDLLNILPVAEPSAMARTLESVLEWNSHEAVCKSRHARQYLQANKTWDVQAHRLLGFVRRNLWGQSAETLPRHVG